MHNEGFANYFKLNSLFLFVIGREKDINLRKNGDESIFFPFSLLFFNGDQLSKGNRNHQMTPKVIFHTRQLSHPRSYVRSSECQLMEIIKWKHM